MLSGSLQSRCHTAWRQCMSHIFLPGSKASRLRASCCPRGRRCLGKCAAFWSYLSPGRLTTHHFSAMTYSLHRIRVDRAHAQCVRLSHSYLTCSQFILRPAVLSRMTPLIIIFIPKCIISLLIYIC